MVLERVLISSWNVGCRWFNLGRPIYNFPVYANFMGLSPKTAAKINTFYNKYLPLGGTNLRVDVLNNRRHQFNGVFLPALVIFVTAVQFTRYNLTKTPPLRTQAPAPGWEVPKDYNWKHLPPTPPNVAMWRKQQELGINYSYEGGDFIDIGTGVHAWYHPHAPPPKDMSYEPGMDPKELHDPIPHRTENSGGHH